MEEEKNCHFLLWVMQIVHYLESQRLLMGINVCMTQLQELHLIFLVGIKIQIDAFLCSILYY